MEERTFPNVFDKVFADLEARDAANKEIYICGGNIVIEYNDVTYEIPLDDCESVSGALKWLHHMSEKTWVTEARLWRIAECMIEHASNESNPW